MALNICMGCFSEWDEQRKRCPYCDWTPEEEPQEDGAGFKSGQILEKRYMLGKLYVKKKDYVIWRCYDSILDIKCFLLVSVGGEVENISHIAWKFMNNRADPDRPVPLSFRQIEKRYALLFSLKDVYMDVRKFISLVKLEKEPPVSVGEVKLPKNAEADHVLASDTLLGGQYRILGPIGIGGFGITYLCEDILLQRNVAVKEYFPAEWAERDGTYVAVKSSKVLEAYHYGMETFCREAKMTAQFIHTPHLPIMYDMLGENDTQYMVMDYIAGISIGKELKKRGYKPYRPDEMAEIILPVLHGLSALHEKKIIHSDISPGNILRTPEGGIVLIDLGAAKYNMQSQPALGAAFLKQDYAAPEQYRTAKEGIPRGEGPWTDIYAVGATMYYLLTGHKPLDALTRLSRKTTDLIPPKKYGVKVKKDWMKLIHRCMEPEASKRIASCAEVILDIQKLLPKGGRISR